MRRVAIGDFKITGTEKKAVMNVLNSNRLSEWKRVKEFERIFADYIGTKHCIAVSSGTAAIMVGLLALMNDERFSRVKRGSKVITTPLTYVSTVNAIVLSGLEPVFVDVDRRTFSLLPEKIEEQLKAAKNIEQYSIILPVHLMGYPCDMDKINAIARKYGLVTFEDSAQAHGTVYKGRKTGSLSLLSDFSFYIAHNIQVGEMGAVVTDDDNLAQLINTLKANGRACRCPVCVRGTADCPGFAKYGQEGLDPRFTHNLIGYNFKTTEFQAALAICQMKKAEDIFIKRSQNVKFLNEKLKKFDNILQLPLYSEKISYLAYPIVIRDNKIIARRELSSRLEKEGIETRPLFGCIPLQQPAYAHLKNKYKDSLKNAEYLGNNALYVACHQYLNKEDLKYMVDVFEKILS